MDRVWDWQFDTASTPARISRVATRAEVTRFRPPLDVYRSDGFCRAAATLTTHTGGAAWTAETQAGPRDPWKIELSDDRPETHPAEATLWLQYSQLTAFSFADYPQTWEYVETLPEGTATPRVTLEAP